MIRLADCLALGYRIRRLTTSCWLVEHHGAYLDCVPTFAGALRCLAARVGTHHPKEIAS